MAKMDQIPMASVRRPSMRNILYPIRKTVSFGYNSNYIPSPTLVAMVTTQSQKTIGHQRGNDVGQTVGHPEESQSEGQLRALEKVRHVLHELASCSNSYRP